MGSVRITRCVSGRKGHYKRREEDGWQPQFHPDFISERARYGFLRRGASAPNRRCAARIRRERDAASTRSRGFTAQALRGPGWGWRRAILPAGDGAGDVPGLAVRGPREHRGLERRSGAARVRPRGRDAERAERSAPPPGRRDAGVPRGVHGKGLRPSGQGSPSGAVRAGAGTGRFPPHSARASPPRFGGAVCEPGFTNSRDTNDLHLPPAPARPHRASRKAAAPDGWCSRSPRAP